MTTNLDNAGFAPELMDVLARFGDETITKSEAAAEIVVLLDRWYTFNGTVAERLANFLLSIDGFIVTDGAPDDAVGSNGQFALDNTNGKLYGPKSNDEWGSSILTLGGEDGRTILSGTGAPGSGTGEDGDFYYDTAASDFYGPKASGAWPTGVSLIGPQGDAGADGDDGREVELQVTATHIQWRYVGEASWTDLIALSALKGDTGDAGADGEEVSLQVTATHIQWRLGTDAWANLIELSELQGPQGETGPQGEGIQFDAVGTFANRSTYDAEAAGFQYLSTDGEDGLGGVDVMYVRVGASGWSDPVGVQGPQGETGDAISLEGFVPYATIVTGSGALIPSASVQFAGASASVLDLDVDTPELGDIYAVSNTGSANATLDAGATGVFRINPASPLDAGDRLVIPPGQGTQIECTSLDGPVFSERKF